LASVHRYSKIFTLAAFLLLAASAYGAAPGPSTTQEAAITTVDIDDMQQRIFIFGSNFGTSLPTVSLAGEPLSVVSNDSSTIVATLPATFLTNPGSHQLMVTTTIRPASTVTFSVTIGVQGPKGDTGVTGDKGDKGDTGLQGLTGATGPQGPKGDTGPVGLMGPAGPKGDTGPQGPKGDTGPAGAMGTGMVWRDATGAFVVASSSVMFTLSRDAPQRVPYFDAQGLVWSVDSDTARISSAGETRIVYDDEDCRGPGYVATSLPPRFVLQTSVNGQQTYLVRPDGLKLRTLWVASWRSSQGSCVWVGYDRAYHTWAIPLNEAVPVYTLPTVTFVGPLHLSTQ